jgi:uncharacterized protein YndB with AHSA1/START domain
MLEVKTEMKIDKPPEVVFEAIVEPTQMAGYFISHGTARMQGGQSVVWRWDDYGAELTIKVAQADPERICFEWEATGKPTTVEIELESKNGGTLVRASEWGWPEDTEGILKYGGQMQGWVHMLTCLKAFLQYGINLRK